MKYRKKPLVIEAMQLTKESSENIKNWIGDEEIIKSFMLVPLGYWIIKGIQGEFYPCPPGVFDMSYEAVDEPISRQTPDTSFGEKNQKEG